MASTEMDMVGVSSSCRLIVFRFTNLETLLCTERFAANFDGGRIRGQRRARETGKWCPRFLDKRINMEGPAEGHALVAHTQHLEHPLDAISHVC